jgi:hypothetical protein
MIISLLTIVVFGVLIGLYLLPVIIGQVRHVPDVGSIATINILLGWTLVGWVVALALALRSANPAAPAVQIVQHLPPSSPSADLQNADWAGPPGPPPGAAFAPPPLVLPPHPADYGDHAEQW